MRLGKYKWFQLAAADTALARYGVFQSITAVHGVLDGL
jgi:hypothetical protein